MRPNTPAWLGITAILSLFFGACALWPFLVHAGVPVYQHDWSWSLESIRFRDGLLQLVSTWNEEGLGHANPFATANPAALFTVACGVLFTPKGGLLVVLALICVAGGCGVMTLARFATGSTAGAILAGFLYLCSPVVFNKISAGQLAYVEAYAIFPWTVYWTIQTLRFGGAMRFAMLAISAAIGCVQPQFFVYNLLQAAVFAIILRGRRSAPAFACVLCAEIVLNLPAVYAAIAMKQAFAFTVPHPVTRYEVLQSAGFFDATRLLGYIIPYADMAYARPPLGGIAQLLLWAVPIVALFGAATAIRDRIAQGILVISACGLLMSMGERGPLAFAFAWAFAHVNAATLLREFYHSSVLTACGFAVASAYACSYARWVTPLVAAVYVFALFPLLYPGHARDLNFAEPPRGQIEANAFLRGEPAGRVLPFPYKMPLQLGSAPVAGVDVFDYADRHHMLASEYAATPEIDGAAAMVAARDFSGARDVLARYGVRYVEWRKYIRSAYPASLEQPTQRGYRKPAEKVFNAAAPDYRRLVSRARCFADVCVGTVPDARPLVDVRDSWIAGVSNWRAAAGRTVLEAPPFTQVAFSSWHLSPAAGWVSPAQWKWANPSWADMIDPDAVTANGGRETIDVRLQRPGTLPYTGGPILVCDPSCRMHARREQAAFEVHGDARIAAMRATGIGDAVSTIHVPELRSGSASFDDAVPWRVRAAVRAAGPVLVVLRTRFDQGWALSGLPVLERLRVDGGLNGWVVDAGRHGGSLTFSYVPQRMFFLAAVVEAALYGALIVTVLMYWQRNLRRVP